MFNVSCHAYLVPFEKYIMNILLNIVIIATSLIFVTDKACGLPPRFPGFPTRVTRPPVPRLIKTFPVNLFVNP